MRPLVSRAKCFADEILVVDDGSTDRTPEILNRIPGLRIIRHRVNMGYGQSIVDSFNFAIRHGYDWLITMDCDGQHDPIAIPRFVRAIGEDDADVVSGSRYLAPSDKDDLPPPDRRSINMRITRMLNDRFGWALTDAFCGFKAYRVESLARMSVTEPGYAMPMQFWAQAAALCLRIREIPVRLVYCDTNRTFGHGLDDPVRRYRHYLDVFIRAVRSFEPSATTRACRWISESPPRECAPATTKCVPT